MRNYSNGPVPPKIKLVENAGPLREEFAPATVVICAQTWMAENLAVDDGGEGIYFNEKTGEHYYTWEAAVRIAKSIPGWHLPEDDEWVAATKACEASPDSDGDYDSGVMELKSKLNINLVGRWFNDSFGYVGSNAFFWTATEYSSNAFFRYFNTGASMSRILNNKIMSAYSVRLVKD